MWEKCQAAGVLWECGEMKVKRKGRVCGYLRLYAERGVISLGDQKPLKSMVCDNLYFVKQLNR